ncbi:MAG: ABC transporter ATP-binding protein [Myxococcota bacterium]
MREERAQIVVVEGLEVEFRPGLGQRRKRILDGVSFSVREGEIFGFVGPNGAGKTTTLKVLMGLLRANAGCARILGHDVGETAFRRHVGFLPENPYFHDYLSARETLDFYARLSGVPASERPERIERLLDWVGLHDAADARLRTFSKGMQQRVGIAQALVHEPKVIFLDEPMSGLDPLGRVEVRDLILRLRAEGRTVLMNTHILSDVETLCDRVAIIAGGRIRYQGSVEDFSAAGERASDILVAGLPVACGAELEDVCAAELRGLGERVELRVAEKHVGDALSRLLAAGAEVISVIPHRASLESIFLSAVEEDSR